MKCSEIQTNLSAYMDRELAPAEEDYIRAHLSVCDQCSSQHTKLLRGWQALDMWDDVTPPDMLRKRILESARPHRKAVSLRGVLSVAAALVLVIGIAIYYSGQEDRSLQEITGRQVPVQTAGVDHVSEVEIIANLPILQEKDFFEVLDELVKIDDIPLDEESINRRSAPQRSTMDQAAS